MMRSMTQDMMTANVRPRSLSLLDDQNIFKPGCVKMMMWIELEISISLVK